MTTERRKRLMEVAFPLEQVSEHSIPRNCRNSAVPCLAAPSAMLAGIDTADRRTWLTSPNRSAGGQFADAR